MTPKQRQALDTIRSFQDKFGYPPSIRELQAALELKSPSGVHRVLTGLEERGFIRRLPHRARAIEIVKNPSLPWQIGQFSVSDLAKEAERRGLVLGKIIETASGQLVSRKFKQIQSEER